MTAFIKATKEGSFSFLPVCPHSHLLTSLFTGIRAYRFVISTCTENQLRQPALWTAQLLDSWPFHQETAIVGLVRSQPVSHSNNSHGYIMIIYIYYPISFVPPENPK